MATLHASVWLLLKERADVETIIEKYKSIYDSRDRLRFLWLLVYYAVQSSHIEFIKKILDENFVESCSLVITRLDSSDLATCLNEAIRKENVELVKILIEVHPDIIVVPGNLFRDRFRIVFTPLELAIHIDNQVILEELMKKYNDEPIGQDEEYPLHFACKYHVPKCLSYLLSLESVNKFINTKDKEGHTPLLLASLYQPEAIQPLLEHGSDVSATTVGYEKRNALQMLCRGCVKGSRSNVFEEDPGPNVNSHQTRATNLLLANDVVYIAPNLAQLAVSLVSSGLDVNTANAPLKICCSNIRQKLEDFKVDTSVWDVYRNVIAYLSSVSNQEVVDEALFCLCHQLIFISTQLRRSNDYDNMEKYIDFLGLIRDLIYILLENGANPGIQESAEPADKINRSYQFLIPPVTCGALLKQMLAAECSRQDQPPSSTLSTHNTPLDIVSVCLLLLYPLQVEEPEMRDRGVQTIFEIFSRLSTLGSKCRQPLLFFLALSIDPRKHIRFLKYYLDVQSQQEHFAFIDILTELTNHPLVEDKQKFAEIKTELSYCGGRLSSLKELLRRDIVHFLGSRRCPDKVDNLPLPVPLKQYLNAFWEKKVL